LRTAVPKADQARPDSLPTNSEDALRTLATHPAIGSRRYADLLGIPGLRSWPIKKSPYLIFYIDDAGQIDIWRVLHGRRDVSALLGENAPGEGDPDGA